MKTTTFLITLLSFCCFSISADATSNAPTGDTPATSSIVTENQHARQMPEPSQRPMNPPLKMVAPGVFEIGRCTIFKNDNKVEFPATVNMQKGLLEYILVGEAGKLHESLLKTEVEPYDLQIALLLTGLEGSLHPLAQQGDEKTPEGDPVMILVRWTDNGKEKTTPVETWLLKNDLPINKIPWTFTGSVIVDGVFLAQSERSIAAIFHDPVAMIDHRLPEGSSDEIWFTNPAVVPAPGTPVTVIVEKISSK